MIFNLKKPFIRTFILFSRKKNIIKKKHNAYVRIGKINVKLYTILKKDSMIKNIVFSSIYNKYTNSKEKVSHTNRRLCHSLTFGIILLIFVDML